MRFGVQRNGRSVAVKSVSPKIRMTPEFLAQTQRAAADAEVSWSEWMTAAAEAKLAGVGAPGWERRVLKAIENLDLAPPKRRR